MSENKQRYLVSNILSLPNVITQKICLYLKTKEIIEFLNVQTQTDEQMLRDIINCNTVFKHFFKQIYEFQPIYASTRPPIRLSSCIYQNYYHHLHHWETSLKNAYWLDEDIKLAMNIELAFKSQQQYTMYQDSWYYYFNKSKIFNMLCRIIPFKSPCRTNLYNVHDVSHNHRELYSMEKKLFKCLQIIQDEITFKFTIKELNSNVENSSMHYNSFNIVSHEMFENNFEVMFNFSEWKKFINWDNFIIIGPCVTSALFNKDIIISTDKIETINIHSYNISYCAFETEIVNIHKQLLKVEEIENIYLTFKNINKINKLFTLSVRGRNINLNILHCCSSQNLSHLLNAETDLFQTVYLPTSNKVLATQAFHQCVVSGYVIPYTLMFESNYINYNAIMIIRELVHNNFNYFLIPKDVLLHVLYKALKDGFSKNHVINYQQVDFYNIQQTFITNFID